MGEFWSKLFSPDGFTPRRSCGDGWTDGLAALHIGGDLFIWLAYLSIPLVLVFLVRRRSAVPFPGLVLLAAAFIVSCGFTHFLDALMFTTPVYRAAGVLKVTTAAVSWAMVFALIPAVPKIEAFLAGAAARPGDGAAEATTEHRPLPAPPPGAWARGYIIALLAAAGAVLVRGLLDDILKGDRAWVIALLAVVYVGWQCGFGPALLALLVSLGGIGWFFVLPRMSAGTAEADLMAAGLFLFCGAGCAALGGSNRAATQRARASLAEARGRQAELEAEAVRRRAVEAELRATAATLKAFYDSAPLAMGVVEPTDDGDLLHVYDNRASCNFFGVGPDQTAGRQASSLGAGPDTIRQWRAKYRQAGDRGRPVGFDHRFDRDGRPGWLSVTVSPLGPGPGGRPRFCYVAEDVTDRRQAEAELRESEARFRSVFDGQFQFTALLAPDGTTLEINDLPLRATGIRRDEVVGRKFWDTPFWAGLPEMRAAWPGRLAAAADLGGPILSEDRYQTAGGETRLADASVSAVRTPDGGVRFFLVQATDTTDRRAAEAEQRASEERFRQLADTIPNLAWMARPDGHIFWYNRRWYEYTGTTPEQMDGWGWRDVHDPGVLPEVVTRWRHSLATGEPFNMVFPLKGADGAFRPFLTLVNPLRDAAGRTVFWFGTNTDVSEQKRAEAELERRVGERTAALNREQQFLRAVLENIEDAVVACDAGGRLTLFNRSTLTLHGLPADPIPSDRWADHYDLFHPDGVTRMAPAEVPLFRALAGEHVRGAEMVVAPVGRPPRRLVASGQPLFDDDRRMLGAVVSMHDVTDRLAAEEARGEVIRQQAERTVLAEQEARFRALAEAVPQIVWVTRPDGYHEYYNPRWYEFTGVPAGSTDGEGWNNLFHPDDRPKAWARWRHSLATGDNYEIEYRLRRHDGQYRWMLGLAQPQRDERGEVVRWYGTCTDIHDSKRQEEQLRAAAARFKALSDSVPQIVWEARPDGVIDYYNEQWYEFTGFDRGLIGQDSWAPLLHPDDVQRRIDTWYTAVQTGLPYQIECRFRDRRTGGYRWFLGRALPQRDENGQILRWFGTCTDIDDARRLAEEARRNADRFRTLTEAIPQMVWNADNDGRVVYFNRRWEEYTGTTVQTSVTSPDLIHPADAPKLDAAWKAAVGSGAGQFAHEFRLRRARDGAYRWVLSNAVTLPAADGSGVEWVGTLTDIQNQKDEADHLEGLVRERTAELRATNSALEAENEERRRAEELVRATARELQRSNGELEQFAYVASHDLQEPLRKIQAFGNLLQTKCAAALPDAGREYVGKMQGSAGRMGRLIEDLLRFSRVTTHAKPFARTELGPLLEDVLEDLELRIEQTGATVDADPPGLPAVDADPTQMRQLFQNLIGNALKFTRPGVPPVVAVRAEVLDLPGEDGKPTETCRLTVSDNGIGFEDRHKERIFQVFQRLHGRDEYDGTGVGLAVCKKIVDRHGGTIVAAGVVGQGATFTITLPTRQAVPPVTPPPK